MAVRTAAQPIVKTLRPVLIVLSVILAAEFVLLVFFPVSILGQENNSLLSIDSSTKEILPTQPLANFQEVVDRSLFSPDRRPIVPGRDTVAAPRVDKSAPLTEKWVLSGVVNTGSKIYAIFASVNLDVRLRLETGMYLEKWKVAKIESDRATVGEGDETFEFFMRELEKKPDNKATPQRPSARPRRPQQPQQTPEQREKKD